MIVNLMQCYTLIIYLRSRDVKRINSGEAHLFGFLR